MTQDMQITVPAEAPQTRRPDRPPRFHLLAKPSGSTCNIDCTYCFFLSKEALYPNSRSRMSDETLDSYIRQLLEAHDTPEVTVAWQGGEPTLMRIDFFRRALDAIGRYRRPGQVVKQTFQTNGLLIDDAWAAFLAENDILVGLSVDGPKDIHDTYRKDRRGQGTFDLVMKGLDRLKAHGVQFNILCTVNAANQHRGREVYQFFRDTLGATWVQFIPIIERATAETLPVANKGWSEEPGKARLLYTQTGDLVTERSVAPRAYGTFLIDIYEDWLRNDVGRVFVQMFDVTLEAYFNRHLLCIHAPTCGYGPALEHNGDVYTCDHFVEPAYKLGNLHDTPLADLVASPQMRRFGLDKQDRLTGQCRTCPVRQLCNGGCPKDRFMPSKAGEAGHNYLCEGLELFYTHTRPSMMAMAHLIRSGRPPREIMALVRGEDARRGLDTPCTCGSGRSLAACHASVKRPLQ
jgi:uncharacterized protein